MFSSQFLESKHSTIPRGATTTWCEAQTKARSNTGALSPGFFGGDKKGWGLGVVPGASFQGENMSSSNRQAQSRSFPSMFSFCCTCSPATDRILAWKRGRSSLPLTARCFESRWIIFLPLILRICPSTHWNQKPFEVDFWFNFVIFQPTCIASIETSNLVTGFTR